MMRIAGPIILIVIAAGLFFGLGEPMFDGIATQRAQLAAYNNALENAAEFRSVRDDLNARYSRIPQAQLDRLNKMLPSKFDNIRLINDINGMAARNGILVKTVSFETPASGGAPAAAPGSVKAVTVRLAASGTYRALRGFLNELERSLRLSDAVALTFSARDVDVYNYEMEIKTYWMNNP